MMRRKIVAGNWKMNKTSREAQVLFSHILEEVNDVPEDVELIICPPAIYLSYLARKNTKKNRVQIGAQNCHFEQSGAYTGELSPDMLRSVAVEYCIIGHSERRAYFNEDNNLLRKKVHAALSVGLKPIYCVGETLEERQENRAKEVVAEQLEGVLADIEEDRFSDIIIAYEPVWAIGTGETATPQQAQEMHAHIRAELKNLAGGVAEKIPVLYGGSCKPKNAGDLFSEPDVDGGLIGGASLVASSFIDIAKSF